MNDERNDPFHERLGRRRHLPSLRQTEAAECGLVCLAMISSYWGVNIDITDLRQRFAISSRGITLANIIKIANYLSLDTRPVRVEVEELPNIHLPAILHWEFRHFVVLKSYGRRTATIHDPRTGVRRVHTDELFSKFTGVALEIWPHPDFVLQHQSAPVNWRDLVGTPQGISSLFARLLCIGFAIQLISLLIPIISQWGIDNVAASGDIDLLTVLAVSLAIMILLQSLMIALRGWSISSATMSFILNWKRRIFSHMTTLPTSYFQQRRVGDITSRYDSVERIIGILNDNFVEGLLSSILGIITVCVLFAYSIQLTVITVVGAVAYISLRIVRYTSIREQTQISLIAGAKENSTLIETIRGIRPIKLFGREKGRENEWLSAAVDECNATLSLTRSQIFFRLISNLISGLEQVIVYWLCIKAVVAGQMTIGMLVAFTAYRSQFYSSVSTLMDNIIDLQTVKIHAQRVSDIVLSSAEEALFTETTERLGEIDYCIELKNIEYRYGAYDAFCLRQISFRIDEGESVAIVGKSGCGKSSVVNIMVGLCDPMTGEIFLGGIPYRALGLRRIRSEIAVVMQDDMLFAGTLAQNIASFEPNLDLERVAECARIAQFDTDILAMPMGYGTLVNDMGSSLSGGQRQRVCIARALYQKPRILIMDEATSHLDLDTERHINQALQKLSITRIIIAHRIDTIRSADRLILMDNGKILADSSDEFTRETILSALISAEK